MRLSLRPFEAAEAGVSAMAAVPGCGEGPGGNGTRWQRSPAAGPLLSPLPALPAGQARAIHARALQGLARQPDAAVSLAVELPFCISRCLCCEREVHAAQPAEVIDDYVDGLISENRLLADRAGARRDVLQLHLGGGCATELSESQLARLGDALQAAWRLPADAELSADCDPRRSGRVTLRLLRGLGFRHVNFGVLDLDPRVQQAIGRSHSAELVGDVCDQARRCGIESINLELMIGLPQQTEPRWQATLEHVIAMAPDRLTLSRYRHRPRLAPVQHAIDAHALPDEATCDRLAAQSSAALCAAGYRWIGADCFVLDGDALATAHAQGGLRRSLISYSATPPTSQLGFGAGAVSAIDGNLFLNEPSIAAWRASLRAGRLPVAQAQLVTEREARRREAVQHLLCALELPAVVACGGLEEGYGRLARRESDGLVRVLSDRITVTEAGRHALHALCSELDVPA